MAREHFDRQLRELQDDLLSLASIVEVAVRRSIEALDTHDAAAARQIIADDDVIDRRQYALEDKALLLIARQAPVATDLRIISAVVGIASELERIGDYAEGTAEIAIRNAHEPLLKPLIDIPRMRDLALAMLGTAMKAFVDRDAEAAQSLADHDDVVDALTTQVQNELLLFMIQDPSTVSRALNLLYVAHNMERVADRATNIAERVVFLVTGEIVALNSGGATHADGRAPGEHA